MTKFFYQTKQPHHLYNLYFLGHYILFIQLIMFNLILKAMRIQQKQLAIKAFISHLDETYSQIGDTKFVYSL